MVADQTVAGISAVGGTLAGGIATIVGTRSSLSEGVVAGGGGGGIATAERPMPQKIGSSDASTTQCCLIQGNSCPVPVNASTV